MMYNHVFQPEDLDGDNASSQNYKRKFRLGATSLAFLGVMVVGAFISTGMLQTRKRGASTSSFPKIEQLAIITGECQKYPEISITGISNNNLGGNGPSVSAEKNMIYDVSMGSETFLLMVTQVTTNTDAIYAAGNGVEGGTKGIGKIAVKGARSIRARFDFMEKDKKPKVLPRFAFTFYDLDQQDTNVEEEFIKVYGFKSAYTTKPTEITHNHDDLTDSGYFGSTQPAGFEDNPKDPMNLNAKQLSKSVTITFEGQSGFEADFGSRGRKHNAQNSHRAVFFSPKATLLCASDLNDIKPNPPPTTPTTTQPAGPLTTAKMQNACVKVDAAGRAAESLTTLKAAIASNKYVKTKKLVEEMRYGSLADLCTEFTDAKSTTVKICIGARMGCGFTYLWPVSSNLQFHNKVWGGAKSHDVGLPTPDTTLIEGQFNYKPAGLFGEPAVELILQGYKLASH